MRLYIILEYYNESECLDLLFLLFWSFFLIFGMSTRKLLFSLTLLCKTLHVHSNHLVDISIW